MTVILMKNVCLNKDSCYEESKKFENASLQNVASNSPLKSSKTMPIQDFDLFDYIAPVVVAVVFAFFVFIISFCCINFFCVTKFDDLTVFEKTALNLEIELAEKNKRSTATSPESPKKAVASPLITALCFPKPRKRRFSTTLRFLKEKSVKPIYQIAAKRNIRMGPHRVSTVKRGGFPSTYARDEAARGIAI
ncbi:unnamed protein product [Enterobius vermicularis]|uniref:Uncharacterized protein n=1 Tax=Enterobius vermicularis TaxID=51028 RepID=A0A0N4V1A5_ENTVE|nr:unnamed protein product [Enterobius vermicularis]